MSSGVKVNPNCVEEWDAMKLKKKHKFLTFKIKDYEEVVVDEYSGEDYDKAKAKLPQKECRYVCVDFPVPNKGNKLLFILWCPDDATGKDKMVYAASKDAVTKKLEGISRAIQANDAGDLEVKSILGKL